MEEKIYEKLRVVNGGVLFCIILQLVILIRLSLN